MAELFRHNKFCLNFKAKKGQPMSLGENLQFLRKSKNMTQEDLAEALCVSRQSVSKWESDATFPEMDKIMQICDLFSCSMDTLIKGSVEKELAEDTAGYDKHMNSFSKAISVGVGLITMSLAICGFLDGIKFNETLIGMIFFVFILISVMIFIVSGINHENFRKANPVITPFYKENEIQSFDKKFSVRIAIGVGIIILGLIFTIGIEELSNTMLIQAFEQFIFLFTISVGSMILVYNGMQKDKYDISKYNKTIEKEKKGSKYSKWYPIIMIVATIIFLLTGFIWKLWEYNWIAFAVGSLLCGIVGILDEYSDKNK